METNPNTEVNSAANLADRLKAETKLLHDRAEGHAFQQAFGAGKLPQATYVRYLGQMHAVYAALEAEIKKAKREEPTLAAVVSERNYRVADLEADLAHFDADPSAEPAVPGTKQIVERIQAAAGAMPAALLGFHYVLEGSNNGSKYIARNIRRAYGLSDAGVQYLDPYGDDQRAEWMRYRLALAELDVSTETEEAMVEAAQAMFNAVAAISAELMEPASASS